VVDAGLPQADRPPAPDRMSLALDGADKAPLRLAIAIGRDGVAHLAVQVADESARQALLDRRDQLASALTELGLQLQLDVGTQASPGQQAQGGPDESGGGTHGDLGAGGDSPRRAWSAQALAAALGPLAGHAQPINRSLNLYA